MEKYFLSSKSANYALTYLKYLCPMIVVVSLSADLFSRTKAGRANPANSNYTYHELALISVEKIMIAAGRYAANGNQTKENLIHLKENIIVGEWRDSTYGEHRSFRRFRKEFLSVPLLKKKSIIVQSLFIARVSTITILSEQYF